MNKADQEDNELLKSCPFCGEEPRLHSGYESGIRLCGCKNWDCEIAGKMFNIDWWNTRPQSTDGDEVFKPAIDRVLEANKTFAEHNKILRDEVSRLREALRQISEYKHVEGCEFTNCMGVYECECNMPFPHTIAQQALSNPNKGGSV